MQENAKKAQKEQRQFTPIGQYKPTGNMVYNPEFFEKLEKRVTFSGGEAPRTPPTFTQGNR
jgi:hypothetical protein